MSKPSVGVLELAMLLAVSRLEREAYGMAIRRDLSERLGRDYAPGAIYTTLQRLEDKGLLTSNAGQPLPIRGGRTRRVYTLTGTGARAIRDARKQSAAIWSGVRPNPRPA
jgi:PadR family transcriptional regulator, regulatory protein PadR